MIYGQETLASQVFLFVCFFKYTFVCLREQRRLRLFNCQVKCSHVFQSAIRGPSTLHFCVFLSSSLTGQVVVATVLHHLPPPSKPVLSSKLQSRRSSGWETVSVRQLVYCLFVHSDKEETKVVLRSHMHSSVGNHPCCIYNIMILGEELCKESSHALLS